MVIKPLTSLQFFHPTILFLSLISCTTLFTLSISEKLNSPEYYDNCAPFWCGNITFPFPFSSSYTFGSRPYDCGLPRFQISCDATSSLPAGLELSGRSYRVLGLYASENLITVVDPQLIDDLRSGSCGSLRNPSLSTPADSAASLTLPTRGNNFTFFKCPIEVATTIMPQQIVGNYSCSEGDDFRLYLWFDGRVSPVATQIPSGCELVMMVPVLDASLFRYGFLNRTSGDRSIELVLGVLGDGFALNWTTPDNCMKCQNKSGRCGYDSGANNIICFCKGGCGVRNKSSRWKLIAGVASGSSFVLLVVVALLIFKYKKGTSAIFKTSYFKKDQTTEDERNAKQFIKNYQSTVLTNYPYNDIRKMTNGFKEKLGGGGYGNVFKGKLSDGRLIAVKMLENCRDNGHNFINEVATIGRIHHVNVIHLLGFCWDRSKQALVYEYMPNGSLADIISKEEVSISLGLARLLEIAIGVAHGIEYLHTGCGSRILHLDIKPQNVLLDQNFNPKISDFGLAKVYSRNRSAVTMTGARGTIGYIAPEIFMRNIGNPSHKSDVYSFGMMLLEIVGGRKHVEPETSNSSEAYFPSWIYDKLIEENVDSVVEEEVFIARKMVMVGLWCIQINPRDRPSMTRVVEMLSGNAEAIEMPPKPFFFSPPRVKFEHDMTSIESDDSALPLAFESGEITEN
ncbi:rust resistance kinase Lr10-like [Cornus florida]|uniref:rust resistance kinase Lr10-like n=1 Tax=Cornus florida TaxID=4283 RepID=UPI00289676FA|nr:rust resistance kinase Lr10-like [Cornus florida]